MNILYIAYSCSPDHGSEDRIGWKIPLESAKTNKVTVITKEEHRAVIEKYRSKHREMNIDFYYVDIPKIYKKVFKGAAYAGRLNAWQKRALPLAKRLCAELGVELIHQITPIEFRSMGDYGCIPDVKFVCGPIGGGEYIPKGLGVYARRHIAEEMLRKLINKVSLLSLKMNGRLKRCDALLFANNETERYLPSVNAVTGNMTEIGIGADEIEDIHRDTNDKKCIFLVAGRLNYRKGHELLMDALALLSDALDFECHIVGTGPELKRLKDKCEKLSLSDRVTFFGRVAFDEMAKIYKNADVLVLPSLRETTGSVLLEGMAKGLPVVTVNSFGGGMLVGETNGWLYSGSSKDEYIRNLSSVLEKCIVSPEDIKGKAQGALQVAKSNTWSCKMEQYDSVYRSLLPEQK